VRPEDGANFVARETMAEVQGRFRSEFGNLKKIEDALRDDRAGTLAAEVNPDKILLRPRDQPGRAEHDKALLEFIRDMLQASDVDITSAGVLREHEKAVELVAVASKMLSDDVSTLLPPLKSVSFLAWSQSDLAAPERVIYGLFNPGVDAVLYELRQFVLPGVENILANKFAPAMSKSIKKTCRVCKHLGLAHKLRWVLRIALDDLAQFMAEIGAGHAIPLLPHDSMTQLSLARCVIAVGEACRELSSQATALKAPVCRTVAAFADLRNKLCHAEFSTLAASDGHRIGDVFTRDVGTFLMDTMGIMQQQLRDLLSRVEGERGATVSADGVDAAVDGWVRALSPGLVATVVTPDVVASIKRVASEAFVPVERARLVHVQKVLALVSSGPVRGSLDKALKDVFKHVVKQVALKQGFTRRLVDHVGAVFRTDSDPVRADRVTDIGEQLYAIEVNPLSFLEDDKERVLALVASLAAPLLCQPLSRSVRLCVNDLHFFPAPGLQPLLVPCDVGVLQAVVVQLHGLFVAKIAAGAALPPALEALRVELRVCRNIISHGADLAVYHEAPRSSHIELLTWQRYAAILRECLK
jgi:hypothetical protein